MRVHRRSVPFVGLWSILGLLSLAFCLALFGCARATEKTRIKVLIVPKFEIGEMSGDFPGEAQLFYEQYCAGCEEVAIPNTTPTAHFFVNEENGVALLVTGSGKTAAGLSLASLLSWDAYDYRDTMIVSVGCGGGSTGSNVLGDVVVVTAACDAELGHRTDVSEMANPNVGRTWFPDESYNEYACERLNSVLCEKAYQLVKGCPLRTTETVRRVLAKSFPQEERVSRVPHISKGTAVTGDCYWKGKLGHENAKHIVEYYKCPDAYAVTEMEEIAIINAAENFGLEDRIISLRAIVNMDTFLDGETPENVWLDGVDFSGDVVEESGETLDIFEPAMENLRDAGQIVINAILAGELA